MTYFSCRHMAQKVKRQEQWELNQFCSPRTVQLQRSTSLLQLRLDESIVEAGLNHLTTPTALFTGVSR